MKQTITLDQTQRTPLERALNVARELGREAGERLASDFWAQQEAAWSLLKKKKLFDRPDDLEQIEEVIKLKTLRAVEVVKLRDAWTEGYDSAFDLCRI